MTHIAEQEPFNFGELSRRQRRSLVFHILYAVESFDYEMSIDAIVDNLNRGFAIDIPLDSDVVAAARSVIEGRHEFDETMKPLLSNWRFDRVGVSTKLILRYALWELLKTDTAATIVINEAIELAKCFAEKDAYKFVNGVLDEQLKQMPGRNVRIEKEDDEATSTLPLQV
jgi:N utilization substance protein B